MNILSPLLWYNRIDPYLNCRTDKLEFDGSREEQLKGRVGVYKVFDEKIADGVLVSRNLLDARGKLIRGDDGKYFFRAPFGRIFEDMRGFCQLTGRHKTYIAFADPGTWSHVNKFELPDYLYDTDDLIDYYNDMNYDLAGSVDWPIVDKIRFVDEAGKKTFMALDLKTKEMRRKLTLELAQDFIKKCNRRKNLGFIPFGTLQGYDEKSYLDSLRSIIKMGYEYVAIGGLPAYSESYVLELLPKLGKVIRSADVIPGVHMYGRFPSVLAVKPFLENGVTSIDNNSSFIFSSKVTHRFHCYYNPDFKYEGDSYVQEGYGLLMPPDNSMMMRKIAKESENHSKKAKTVKRLCDRAFKMFMKFAETESDSDLKEFVRVYEHMSYALNDLKAYKVKETTIDNYLKKFVSLIMERKPWHGCGCSGCRKLGAHMLLPRGSTRAYWIFGHNSYVHYFRIKREMAKYPKLLEKFSGPVNEKLSNIIRKKITKQSKPQRRAV